MDCLFPHRSTVHVKSIFSTLRANRKNALYRAAQIVKFFSFLFLSKNFFLEAFSHLFSTISERFTQFGLVILEPIGVKWQDSSPPSALCYKCYKNNILHMRLRNYLVVVLPDNVICLACPWSVTLNNYHCTVLATQRGVRVRTRVQS